jgi:hypothetical protein
MMINYFVPEGVKHQPNIANGDISYLLYQPLPNSNKTLATPKVI